ncbi:MAG: SOS response-associated peptidase [Flammeovirgaceae bacterium]|nr:SOS response-associated peptidase [Flammeovirgaceae bacterium]
MCYDISYLTKRQIDYAKRYGRKEDVDDIQQRHPPVYHTSGFDHPDIPVITQEDPDRIQMMEWGLIPWWIKTNQEAIKISNSTLNARAETLSTKPAFRDSLVNKRCLVLVDGFFEHHHHKHKTYPYFIFLKNGEPFSIAGLYSEWTSPDRIVKRTVSLITTKGNSMLSRIHNNPKMDGPRMPAIVIKEQESDWLDKSLSTKDSRQFQEMLVPYDSDEMESYTVGKLRGKNAPGNSLNALQKQHYPELDQPLSLF